MGHCVLQNMTSSEAYLAGVTIGVCTRAEIVKCHIIVAHLHIHLQEPVILFKNKTLVKKLQCCTALLCVHTCYK